jgi:hypothetical protein
LIGRKQLCEEFGFSEFSKFSQPKKDSQEGQIDSSFIGVQNAVLNKTFDFIVNGTVIEINIATAAALFSSSPRTTFR